MSTVGRQSWSAKKAYEYQHPLRLLAQGMFSLLKYECVSDCQLFYGAPVYVDICAFAMIVALFAMMNFVLVAMKRDGTKPYSPKNPTTVGVVRMS